jgi:hypothetical protein
MIAVTSCPGESGHLDGFAGALAALGVSDLESAG